MSVLSFTLISVMVTHLMLPHVFQEETFLRVLTVAAISAAALLMGSLYIFLIQYFIKSMTGFKKVLNEMGTYLFITDTETHAIHFMNDAMKEHYGFEEEVLGRRCWEALQTGLSGPCSFCPIPGLMKKGQDIVVWEERNSRTGRYYKNTSSIITWGGLRRAYIQHSVDIHDLKTAEAALTRRLEQRELLYAISQHSVSEEDLAPLIKKTLGTIGSFMKVSKVVIARLNTDTNRLEYEYEWYNERHNVPKLSRRSYLFSRGGILYDTFITAGAPCLSCDNVEQIPELSRFFKPLGIKSFISTPIMIHDVFWGVLGIDECVAAHRWDESDTQFIQVIANTIAGIIIRETAEKKLLRMSSIVNSTPQYVSYFTPAGQFEYINPGVSAISGYSAEELLRGGMDILFDEETRVFIHEIFIPAVLERESHQTELPIIRKDGTRRILSFSAFTVGPHKEGLGGIASDISELRELETALITAKERAEQSSLAKSNFLSRMSHEMRTPMNAIIGMTTIARGSRNKEKLEYCLGKIRDASVHLLGVINDILDMSKIEAGKFELSLSEFDFEKTLQRVTGVMHFRIAEKRQNLLVKLDPAIPKRIVSDEQRLAQVITNLLSNAVKFTPEEGIITVSVQEEGGTGTSRRIRCSVADTGIGISAEQQARLFSLFEQADTSIARKFGGTGLGLAISKSIVKLMGGEIWVASDLGQGAVFTFEVTVSTGDNAAREVPAPRLRWEKLRILVVDDSSDVLEYMKEFSRAQGIGYTGVSSGSEAWELIEKMEKAEKAGSGGVDRRDLPFDVVFADWRMPEMNGIELARRIKARFGPHIVVIIISAAEWDTIEPEAKDAGVDGFIPKPLFPSIIVDCIAAHLSVMPAGAEDAVNTIDDRHIFAGRRILLVEDVEINREIVLALLEPTGVAIDTAANGREALNILEENPSKYHLILMDIHMPEMDGFEAVRRIRNLPSEAARQVPVVAMTANVFREDIEKCLAAGMNDHIGKPIDLEELVKKLTGYLLPSAAGGQPPAVP
ncbi:MAG: response regulator [Spirochaetaceae bacterium]|jgi:PAS domain S-box-containing protein|nr:response regulator [Spirochaetaceae bacterium]